MPPRTKTSPPGSGRRSNVTIIRDDWGIAHVYGKTDADAVFGVMYAQAEDDFNRVETNYLNSMGRLAEAEGEAEVYRDLRMKLFIDPGRHEGAVPEEPGVAEGADERLGRRPELLPAQASGGEAARDHAIRAVDGAHLQRGQHRRRHRAGQPDAARGVLRQRPEDADRGPSRRSRRPQSRPDRTASPSRRRTPAASTRCC